MGQPQHLRVTGPALEGEWNKLDACRRPQRLKGVLQVRERFAIHVKQSGYANLGAQAQQFRDKGEVNLGVDSVQQRNSK